MAFVAPLVGAWIEIVFLGKKNGVAFVAPLVGAWIEMQGEKEDNTEGIVAPLVGAWIEIHKKNKFHHFRPLSLLSWERGLKY